ncbi:MAG: DsbA family oxidoreductase [Dehalococcoidia bacterium]
MNEEARPERASIIMLSDVVCPWCYVGLKELEKLQEQFAVDIQWSPFLLDPTVPPEGRSQTPYTKPGDPPTPVEQRAERLGIKFTRGRTFRPNSHLALETAMYASEAGIDDKPLHRALYKAHFEDLEDVSDIEVLVRIGAENGLDAGELRTVLETRRYEEAVDDAIGWAQSIGVTAVPTFIFDGRHGVVGAQEYEVLERVMEQLGYEKRPRAAADA